MTADAADEAFRSLLVDLLKIPSVSGQEGPLTHFVADWARERGLKTDLWQAQIGDVQRFDWPIGRHLPLEGRPTLVVCLPGRGGGRSLLFNAHADVVGEAERSAWQHDPWGGEIVGDRVFGRGACDVKGPLVSALWAMTLLQNQPPLAGDVLLELIPGEEDCVGLGTLTSLARGYTADGCIVLEPTEDQPRCASRGGLRFEIIVHGKAVHGTVKWLGVDAIDHGRLILNALHSLEAAFHQHSGDDLFQTYPLMRPITVDTLHAGRWQGMVADECRIGGYFELLPRDDVEAWKKSFARELSLQLANANVDDYDLCFPETYFGHRIDPESPFCQAAQLIDAKGFNSGCEAGLRAKLMQTPTMVWGPGTLAQAHAADEYVDFASVRYCARQFAATARRWCEVER